MIYAVIDTNILVSAALAYNNRKSIPYLIFKGVFDKSFIPLVDDNIVKEYRNVLYRPKFSFETFLVDKIINTILKYAVNQTVPSTGTELPDEDDIIFYDVAVAHQDKGAYLVTGNQKHFPNCPFVISARDFLTVITPSSLPNVVSENKVPYDAYGLLDALHKAQRLAYENGVANLSEEEIEAEIKTARREQHQR